MIDAKKVRRPGLLAGTSVLLMLLTGCGTTSADNDEGAEAARSPEDSITAPASTPAPPSPTGAAEQPKQAMDPSRPVSFTIEALDRESDIIETGLRQDRTLQVPPEYEGAPASWYNGSPTPGEDGPAVLLGHVNSTQDDSGVFYNLGGLDKGQTITINREDGSTATFEIYKSRTYPKDEFPTRAVYSPTRGAELRLITCDGFTEDTGRFVENLVIYAKLTKTS